MSNSRRTSSKGIRRLRTHGVQSIFDDDVNMETIDLTPLYDGDVLLKFGRSGKAHERLIQLSKDNRYIVWTTPWWTFKREPCEVSLDKVKRIQQGQTTAPFERYKRHFGNSKPLSFSLLYDNGGDRSLDLIASNSTVFKTWFLGLRYLIEISRNQRENMDIHRRFLKAKWDVADLDHNGSVSLKEVTSLINTLGLNKPVKTIKKMFQEVDGDGNGRLSFEEFCRLMEILCRRPDLEFMWKNLIVKESWQNNGEISPFGAEFIVEDHLPKQFKTISLAKFVKFWNDIQQENISESDALQLINDVRTSKIMRADNVRISYNLWVAILTDRSNDAYDPKKQELHQSMDYPLSHYFIASSHNTYLEGDQLTSKSSVNRYINDLCKGCRCVELDCWDGDNGEPIIYHGHTLTSKILFKDVIGAIKTEAFRNSPYPVILSIENHCSLDQQKKMADTFVAVLGKMILMPKDLINSDGSGNLPSPNQLKYKILIKGKRNEEGFEGDDMEDENDDVDFDEDSMGVNEEDSPGLTAATAATGGTTPTASASATTGHRIDRFSIRLGTSSALGPINEKDIHEDEEEEVKEIILTLPNKVTTQNNKTMANNFLTIDLDPIESECKSEAALANETHFYKFNSSKSNSFGQMSSHSTNPSPRSISSTTKRVSTIPTSMGGGHRSEAMRESSLLPSYAKRRPDVNESGEQQPPHPHFSVTAPVVVSPTATSSNRAPSVTSGSSDSKSRTKSSLGISRPGLVSSAPLKIVKREQMHPDLSDITYLGGIKNDKVKGFHDTSVPCDLMSSFKETAMLKLTSDPNVGKLWMRHNIRHMSRIYPRGTRVDSSNMDPLPAWCVGCQLVALNYQTPELSMQLNDGKFRENGNCGYVLKPAYMVSNGAVPADKGVRLTVQLLSAQNLPRPPGATREKGMNPYVLISMHGEAQDMKVYRSKTIQNNGFNPIWDEVFIFEVNVPEIAIICFRVFFLDNLESSDFVAYASIPIPCFRNGLRCLMLYDENGNQMGDYNFASILLRIAYQQLDDA